MNLNQYIKKYGKYTFQEKPFNEVDNVVFSCLAYLDFECQNKKIGDLAEIYLKRISYSQYKYHMGIMRTAIKILKSCAEQVRFQNIKMIHYKKLYTKKTQFQAMSFLLDHHLVYVAFSGTNHLISGWEEDFTMAYRPLVDAQQLAISYINKYYLFSKKKLIIGGHSKGGNLAIIASMYSPFLIKRRIIQIYSNDGLGIMKEQLHSSSYLDIKSKVIKLIPNYSVVGVLLFSENYQVIQSINKNIFAHNPIGWKVENDHFVIQNLSSFSKIVEKSFRLFLDQYTTKEKEEFVTCFFDVFRKLEIESLNDFIDKRGFMIRFIIESRSIDVKVKNMLKKFLEMIRKCYLEYKRTKRK